MDGAPAASPGGVVRVEFSGGLELLLRDRSKPRFTVPLPSSGPFTVAALIRTLQETVIHERPELFALEGTVRPGILVLINDADWELEGGLTYALQAGDEVVFISTLHGEIKVDTGAKRNVKREGWATMQGKRVYVALDSQALSWQPTNPAAGTTDVTASPATQRVRGSLKVASLTSVSATDGVIEVASAMKTTSFAPETDAAAWLADLQKLV